MNYSFKVFATCIIHLFIYTQIKERKEESFPEALHNFVTVSTTYFP